MSSVFDSFGAKIKVGDTILVFYQGKLVKVTVTHMDTFENVTNISFLGKKPFVLAAYESDEGHLLENSYVLE